ncbi:MAG: hypothetical protein JWL92_511 [Candidatus Nomurabacteria bacterium]|nr:hypothetical protein [Candidatus Nomurabacteria bacterium]
MEPIVSTSFIPKRPVSAEPIRSSSSGSSVGLMSFITFIVVAGTALSFAGVYFYKQSLDSQRANLQAQIAQAQEGLGTSFVTDMKRLSQRIEGVKSLIRGHVVVTPIFAALQATTLQSVQYQNFTYEFLTDKTTNTQTVSVTIKGIAKNYATLALQSDAYAKSPIIHNPVFSGLTVEDKTARVGFKLTFSVNGADLSYQTFIQNLQAVPANTTTQ